MIDENMINELIKIHNTIFDIKVSGDDVNRMYDARTRLQEIIKRLIENQEVKDE